MSFADNTEGRFGRQILVVFFVHAVIAIAVVLIFFKRRREELFIHFHIHHIGSAGAPGTIASKLAWVTSVESLAGLREVDDGSPDFLFRNSFLRLAFLLLVDGLFLFSTFGAEAGLSWLPVLIEKFKVEPMVREKVNAWPWLASVWQSSRNLEAKEELSSPTAIIFNLNLN